MENLTMKNLKKQATMRSAMIVVLGMIVGTLIVMSVYKVGPLFGEKEPPAAVVVDESGNILQDLRPYVGQGATAPSYGPLAVIGGIVGVMLVLYLFSVIGEKVEKVGKPLGQRLKKSLPRM